MDVSNQSEHKLPKMRNKKLLKLLWRSFSGCDSEHITVVFPSKGSQHLINGCRQPIGTYIIQHARLNILDAALTLILRMRRSPCCCLFCIWKLPIDRLCITATKSLCNYRTYRTPNRWRSIDALSQNGLETMLLPLSPLIAANTLVMHNSN